MSGQAQETEEITQALIRVRDRLLSFAKMADGLFRLPLLARIILVWIMRNAEAAATDYVTDIRTEMGANALTTPLEVARQNWTAA